MILGTAQIPDGGEMTLVRGKGQYLLMADGYRLMTSSLHLSEESLAREALSRVDCKRVLIGGLGMGFTLRSALDLLSPEAEVVVAELVSEVVDWNRQYLGKLAHHPLRDPRASVFIGDVAQLLSGAEKWDAILLDVDNGARAFTRSRNQRLYERSGLDKIKNSLNPNGVLALWSSVPNQGFRRQLKRTGFRVEKIRIKETIGPDKFYNFLYLARPQRSDEPTDWPPAARPGPPPPS